MELALLNDLLTQEPVDDAHGDVQSLGHQPKLPMHIYHPLDKESPRSVLDFSLNLSQVLSIYFKITLKQDHRFKYFLSELSNRLRVPHVQLILQYHFLHC